MPDMLPVPLSPIQAGTAVSALQSGTRAYETTWVYRSLDVPGGSSFSGIRTFQGPGTWIVAGDWYVVSNQTGDAVPQADCLWPWLFCVPNTGTTSLISLAASETLQANCGNGTVQHTCTAWSVDESGDQMKVADVVCQTMATGCEEINGCGNGVFVTKVWWASGLLESQWLLPSGSVSGGTQFESFSSAWIATTCIQATATPTHTPTFLPTPTATPTATSTKWSLRK
jgi:hypothetical protein